MPRGMLNLKYGIARMRYSVGAEYLGMDGRVEYLGFVIFRIRNIVLLNPNTTGSLFEAFRK